MPVKEGEKREEQKKLNENITNLKRHIVCLRYLFAFPRFYYIFYRLFFLFGFWKIGQHATIICICYSLNNNEPSFVPAGGDSHRYIFFYRSTLKNEKEKAKRRLAEASVVQWERKRTDRKKVIACIFSVESIKDSLYDFYVWFKSVDFWTSKDSDWIFKC